MAAEYAASRIWSSRSTLRATASVREISIIKSFSSLTIYKSYHIYELMSTLLWSPAILVRDRTDPVPLRVIVRDTWILRQEVLERLRGVVIGLEFIVVQEDFVVSNQGDQFSARDIHREFLSFIS